MARLDSRRSHLNRSSAMGSRTSTQTGCLPRWAGGPVGCGAGVTVAVATAAAACQAHAAPEQSLSLSLSLRRSQRRVMCLYISGNDTN